MEYEFHPWEIFHGGKCPYPEELGQIQCRNETAADAERTRRVERLGEWAWSVPRDHSYAIHAFRRVKIPETHTITGYNRPGAGWAWAKIPLPSDTHRLTVHVDANGDPCNFACERIKP